MKTKLQTPRRLQGQEQIFPSSSNSLSSNSSIRVSKKSNNYPMSTKPRQNSSMKKSSRVESMLQDSQCIALRKQLESCLDDENNVQNSKKLDFSQIETNQLNRLISHLREYSQHCAVDGNYAEARRSEFIGSRAKSVLEKRTTKVKPTVKIVEEQKESRSNFDLRWRNKFNEYENETKLKREKLQKKQDHETRVFERVWANEMPQKYRKPSHNLLQLMQIEKSLAISGEIDRADYIHTQVVKQTQIEMENAQSNLIHDYQIARSKLAEKQSIEKNRFEQTRKHGKDLLEADYKADMLRINHRDLVVQVQVKESILKAKVDQTPPTRSAGVPKNRDSTIASLLPRLIAPNDPTLIKNERMKKKQIYGKQQEFQRKTIETLQSESSRIRNQNENNKSILNNSNENNKSILNNSNENNKEILNNSNENNKSILNNSNENNKSILNNSNENNKSILNNSNENNKAILNNSNENNKDLNVNKVEKRKGKNQGMHDLNNEDISGNDYSDNDENTTNSLYNENGVIVNQNTQAATPMFSNPHYNSPISSEILGHNNRNYFFESSATMFSDTNQIKQNEDENKNSEIENSIQNTNILDQRSNQIDDIIQRNENTENKQSKNESDQKINNNQNSEIIRENIQNIENKQSVNFSQNCEIEISDQTDKIIQNNESTERKQSNDESYQILNNNQNSEIIQNNESTESNDESYQKLNNNQSSEISRENIQNNESNQNKNYDHNDEIKESSDQDFESNQSKGNDETNAFKESVLNSEILMDSQKLETNDFDIDSSNIQSSVDDSNNENMQVLTSQIVNSLINNENKLK